jgi:hypothetical protein
MKVVLPVCFMAAAGYLFGGFNRIFIGGAPEVFPGI